MNRARWIVVGVVCGLCWCVAGGVRGDGPADNDPERVRRLPKLGVEVPAEKRTQLEQGLKELGAVIAELRQRTDARTRELWPDVAIYHKAVQDALQYQEFFQDKEVDDGSKLLATGLERGKQLLRGEAPWTLATGPVARGYVSRIDDSVQPYGVVIPATLDSRGVARFPGGNAVRLDIWLHGRGEVLSELNFVRDRGASPGPIQPAETIVLHPYGRWNNAFKLAGEIDVLEALASVRRRYPIDEDRIAMRGFSMGGAGAWHMAVHYPDLWFAANPGAGFSETPDFLKTFQKQTLKPLWFEEKLWQLYDCPGWAANLRQCPTIAYSGDKDTQKQAADIMVPALAREQLRMQHIIGPNTAHSLHPGAFADIESRLANLARQGRRRVPLDLSFVTYTLRYNRCYWLRVDELQEHWKQARVSAQIDSQACSLKIRTENVVAFTIDFHSGDAPWPLTRSVQVEINGAKIEGPQPASDGSWQVAFHRQDKVWRMGPRLEAQLAKRHGIQGPIDDAFLDSFLMVHPTGKGFHETTSVWADAELTRAQEQWRRHFRGVARVKEDRDVTEADIANSNLVLWGDPASNQILAKIVERLPIRWDKESLRVGTLSFPSERHALVAIYPNPLNPSKYVVLNSGFTFREFTHLNNARQVPVLPDWAVIDLTTPPGTVWPGKVVAADFFDEQWQLKPTSKLGD